MNRSERRLHNYKVMVEMRESKRERFESGLSRGVSVVVQEVVESPVVEN